MDSPFRPYLYTNYVPSAAEVHQIRNLISQPANQLAHMNNEITRIQTFLADLTRERDNLVNQIDAHHALISPARRLPPELFQEIFIRCLPTKRNAVMSAREAPVLLCHICSTWRSIALSTPRLWSSVHAVVPKALSGTLDDSEFRWRIDFLNVWLKRAGVCPLSISLFAPSSTRYPEAIAQFIESLFPFSHRWKSIEFRGESTSMRPFLTLKKEDVPMLETIEVVETALRLPGRLPWEDMAILEAPCLRRVTFSRFDRNPFVLSLPWSQLTELCLEGEPSLGYVLMTGVALTILRQCPKLVTCTLHITERDWPEPDPAIPEEPLILPALQSLRTFVETDYISGLYNQLILPELQDITLKQNLNRSNPTELESFMSLLARSGSLTSLALHSDLMFTAVIECLRLIPSLTRLHLTDLDHENSVQDTLLHTLTPTTENQCLCPALEIIELAQCNAFSDEALLMLIRARTTSVRPDVVCLKDVKLSQILRTMEMDILTPLRPLMEMGLQVSLDYFPGPAPEPDTPWTGLQDESPL